MLLELSAALPGLRQFSIGPARPVYTYRHAVTIPSSLGTRLQPAVALMNAAETSSEFSMAIATANHASVAKDWRTVGYPCRDQLLKCSGPWILPSMPEPSGIKRLE